MKYIKIGNKEVPVWPEEYQINGNVSKNPSIQTPPRAVCFENGVDIGDGFASIGLSSTGCSIGGGRTALHDDSELVVSNYYDYPDAGGVEGSYAKRVDWLISRVEGETTIEVASGFQQVVNFLNPLVGTDRTVTYEYKWIAIPYRFIKETLEEKRKVLNYKIMCINRTHTVYAASGEERTVYNDINTPINLNFAWWNDGDRFMYLDPEDKPEEDEDPNKDDPDYPSEPSTPDQDHTPIYDPIPIPNLPTLGSAGAGFITMYKLGLAAINLFTNDMFVDTVWEAIKNYFGQPMDFLVGCMLLPFEPETGSSYYPKFGDDIKFAHAYPAVSNQYKEIDCGTVFIKKYWGSCFDYEPFTKIQIWLPYIGYRDLAVDEIMGNAISVKYHCDCLTGDCVAFVLDNLGPEVGPTIPRVIAQFYGNCGVRVPFGSVSYDAAVAAGISLIGSAASNALIPGAAPAIEGIKGNGGIIGGAAAGAQAFGEAASSHSSSLVGSTVNFVQSMKPTVQKGGAAGASNGYMSIQKPYLIRRVPRQNLPGDYVKFKGYPSNISGKLADFSGYAEVDDIQLNNIPAMSVERSEIISWLNGGVLI